MVLPCGAQYEEDTSLAAGKYFTSVFRTLVKRSPRSTGARHRQRPGASDAAKHTRSRTSSDVREIPIEAIDWSSALRSPNRAHVGRLADATSLPLLVVWEVERGKFRGVDGFHRWLVAKAQGDKRVQAEVRHYPQGELGEKRFDFESIELNIQHGLPLTRYERNRAILKLWRRWGRSEDRPDGVTLEEVGKVFNLTKQRVGQIIQSNKSDTARAVLPELFESDVSKKTTGVRTRFNAAAKRLSTVLRDTNVMRHLISDQRPETRKTLQELRDLLDVVLGEVNRSTLAADATSSRSKGTRLV